jgi:hypothetical protein
MKTKKGASKNCLIEGRYRNQEFIVPGKDYPGINIPLPKYDGAQGIGIPY